MKENKQDKSLREMFRKKLERAEVVPDPSVSVRLMNKLAVREFLHFTPFRLNIYYIGAAAAVITGAALLFTSQPGERTAVADKDPHAGQLRDSIYIQVVPPLVDTSDKGSDARPMEEKMIIEPGKEITPDIQHETLQKAGLAVKAEMPASEAETLRGRDLLVASSDKGLQARESRTEEELLFVPSVSDGCAPLKVHFQNRLAEDDSCSWSFGDGGTSSLRDPDWIYDVEGEYKVVLRIYGKDGLIASGSSYISVHPKPVARFEITPDKLVRQDEEVRFQNFSTGADRYSWKFGDGSSSDQFEPVHTYKYFGSYTVSLIAISENGCEDSLTVFNAFSGSAYYIKFPNKFIPGPNGPSGGVYSGKIDEAAQVFHPEYSGVSEYNLKIFSNLGALLFESNDIATGWDGYYRGELADPGVYVWKVRGKFTNGEPFTRMGDVTLIKN